MSVFDKRKKPLMRCSGKRARVLLERGRTRIHKMRPFTLRLVDRLQEESKQEQSQQEQSKQVQSQLQPIALTIDPGSKTTGIALSRREGDNRKVLYLIELKHRGQAIRVMMALHTISNTSPEV